MQEYQQRVVEEAEALADKLGRLAAFVMGERFMAMDVEACALLCEQGDHMTDYLRVLRARIERFKAGKE